jgi:hypothetical protein
LSILELNSVITVKVERYDSLVRQGEGIGRKQSSAVIKDAKISYCRSDIKKVSGRIQTFCASYHFIPHNTMASVYKSLSKANGHKEEVAANGIKRNKQRVLILSSRGITYR